MNCNNCKKEVNNTQLYYCNHCGAELREVKLPSSHKLIKDIAQGKYGQNTLFDKAALKNLLYTAKQDFSHLRVIPFATISEPETPPNLITNKSELKLIEGLIACGIVEDIRQCNPNLSGTEKKTFAQKLRDAYLLKGIAEPISLVYGMNAFLAAMLNVRIDSWETTLSDLDSFNLNWITDSKGNIKLSFGSKLNIELIKCPKGDFLMGYLPDESTKKYEKDYGKMTEDDMPLHRVVISQDFYIGKFPVTQIQYKSLTGNNPSFFYGEDNPVDSLNWQQTKNFCDKLNSLTEHIRPKGYIFDLPTESQWEYACRGLQSSKECELVNNDPNQKNSYLEEICWCANNSDDRTHPVSSSNSNKWGIYDMLGNISEWCFDIYGPYPELEKDSIDPIGAKTGDYCVLRGGNFAKYSSYCTPYNRDYDEPAHETYFNGFRLALVPEAERKKLAENKVPQAPKRKENNEAVIKPQFSKNQENKSLFDEIIDGLKKIITP